MSWGPFTWEAFATLVAAASALAAALIIGLRQNRLQAEQARIAQATADRTNNLSYQTLQLGLLERRLVVVDEIRRIWGEWMRDGAINDEGWDRLRSTLHLAQLLYPKDIEISIGEALSSLLTQKIHQRRANQYHSQGKEEKAKEHLEKSFAADDKVHEIMQPLLDRVIAASRVVE